VFAQLLGLLVLPLLTRMYVPEQFGSLQLYTSILNMIMVGATLRYEVALLRATPGAETKSVLSLSLTATVAVSIVVFIGSLTFNRFPLLSAERGLPFPALVLFGGVLAGGIYQFVTYWMTREKAFSVSASSKISQSCTYAAVALALGLIPTGGNGLLYADVLGRVAAVLSVGFWMKVHWQRNVGAVSWAGVRQAAHKYREFPLISLPGGMVNSLGGALTPILIYATFTASVAGQFGLVDRVLTLPVALVVTAVSQVYTSQLAEDLRSGADTAMSRFRHYLVWISGVAAIPVIIVSLAAPVLFRVVLGEQWQQAGEFAQLLAPTYFLLLLSGGTTMTLVLLGHQKMQLAWEVGRLAAMVVVWTMVAHYGWPPRAAVLCHSLVTAAASLAFLWMAHRALQRHVLRDGAIGRAND
jgi:O-antigen/teichoic acid export membrane protein